MDEFNIEADPHVRFNPLKDEWILVSPHRTLRPWMGQTEADDDENAKPADNNPLCPGATRGNGAVNPMYESIFVFDNDFPALMENTPAPSDKVADPLFRIGSARGKCKVMCFHPNTNVTIPIMKVNEIKLVIDEWINQEKQLGSKYKWVQIFENKGAVMGCSNPHPHCQIWASSYLPNELRVKDRCQMEYYQKYNRCLLKDYVEKEINIKKRIVSINTDWVALVPFWAMWPFETMILPVNHYPRRFRDLPEEKRTSLASIMKLITTKYDNLFKCNFPYSMGWHGAPTGPNYEKEDDSHWIFHGIYLPPLLRSATIKKFFVGYEMLAQAQRDLTPEQAAQRLREQPDIHYTKS